MSQQIAQLYLRGAVLKKMKSMTEEEKRTIEDIMQMITDDSDLQASKREFCAALRRTIGNEYANEEVAMEEFNISIMKAAIAAKYGFGNLEPNEQVLTDPKQRKKWFQTWIFGFLKQILRENKIPGRKDTNTINMSADMAAIQEIKNIILRKIKELKYADRTILKSVMASMEVETLKGYNHVIHIDQWALPISIIEELNGLITKYLNLNVIIKQEYNKITINSDEEFLPQVSVKQQKETRYKYWSFEHQKGQDDDNSNKYYLEGEVSALKEESFEDEFVESDTIKSLRETLPDDAVAILNIIIDPPNDYVEQYGSKSCKSHLSKYLNIRLKEVNRLMNVIKINMMAHGIGSI